MSGIGIPPTPTIITCTVPGPFHKGIGNVREEEICLNITDIPNLTLVHNTKAFTNGTDEESDESLLERLLERVRHPTGSGNKNDYRQWAKEVAGVVDAVIFKQISSSLTFPIIPASSAITFT